MATVTVGTENSAPVELHYEDVGSGPPVVLIHGWPLSGRAWESQVPALVDAGRRVITYDRRGFGQSSQPWNGYDYDTFAADLDQLMQHLDLRDTALVGFSMGGGEVARYVATYGQDRLHSVVFASAVPPYLHRTDDNPDGPLDDETAAQLRQGLEDDRDAFFDEFMTQFFTAGDELKVSEEQRQEALEVCKQSDQEAALACLEAFATTDFREDLPLVTVPTLVIHGDSDGIVPFEVSGQRTHQSVYGCELVVIEDGPHGINTSHAQAFNDALVAFLAK